MSDTNETIASDEAAIRLVAKMYDARDALRRLWGTAYKARIREIVSFICERARDLDTRPSLLALSLAREATDKGNQLIFIVAIVEISEGNRG